MNLFLSTYKNKIDKKGRVSVPSSFRSVIGKDSFAGIVIYQSLNNDYCIEACSLSRIEKINEMIDMLEPFSTERDALETTIMAGSVQLTFDAEGRIILPKEFIENNQLQNEVCFVGKGITFEIWQPRAFLAHKAKAQQVIKDKKILSSLKKLSINRENQHGI